MADTVSLIALLRFALPLLWFGIAQSMPASEASSMQGRNVPIVPIKRSDASTKPPAYVFRSDCRSPDAIRVAGGFLPRTQGHKTDASFSAYNHARGDIMKDTIYVSTTSRLDFAKAIYKGCWIYKIRTTPNMIDLAGSLQDFSPFPEQDEYSAIGGIYWSQVVSWISNPKSEKTSSDEIFIVNEDYDPYYDNFVAGGSEPQLGFLPSHIASGYEPFNGFKNRPIKDRVREFMQKCLESIGWPRFAFPVFSDMETCTHLDKLSVGIKLSNGWGSGTNDNLSIIFPLEERGLSNVKTTEEIPLLTDAMSSSARWVDVDVNRFFGSPSIPASRLRFIGLRNLNVGGYERKLQGESTSC